MDLLEKSDDFFEFPDIQIGMLFKPMLLTIVFEDLRVWMYPFAADYGPIQLQEAAVGVIGKTWVGGQLGQSFDDFIVDAEVEQGIISGMETEAPERTETSKGLTGLPNSAP